jgi:hypothetical protein
VLSFPTGKLNGAPLVIRDPDFVSMKAVMKSPPVNLSERVLSVKIPSLGSLTVDWTGSMPIITH